jgi:4-hydroxybenzoate polyprenyltransferase
MLKTYAQLLRLPNVFTAWSDMLLAWFWARFHWASVDSILAADMGVLLLLLLASGTLYCSGMAWNDFFDVEQDLRERPNRPIPSGRVKRSTAGLVAGGLMVLGLGATV